MKALIVLFIILDAVATERMCGKNIGQILQTCMAEVLQNCKDDDAFENMRGEDNVMSDSEALELICAQNNIEVDNSRSPVFHSNDALESGTPIFRAEPKQAYYIIKNKPVLIGCEASPATEIKFKCAGQWISPNRLETRMMRDPEKRLKIVRTVFQVTLRDAEEYFGDGDYWCECHARNDDTNAGTHATKVSRRASVVVAYLKRRFEMEPTSRKIRLNSPVELSCLPPQGKPEPRIFWLKNGELIDTDGDADLSITNGGNLLIGRARMSDMGRYTCAAENVVRRRLSDSAMLTIYVDGGWSPWGPWHDCSSNCDRGIQTRSRECGHPEPLNGGAPCTGDAIEKRPCVGDCTIKPNFLNTPYTETFSWPGAEAEVKCVANGNPIPVVTWTKDNQPLPYPAINTQDENQINSTIKFKITQENKHSVFGVYNCSAANIAGENYKEIILIEANKPGMPGVNLEAHNPTQVNLRITRPRFNGGVDVNRYVVRYRIEDQPDSEMTKVVSVEHRQKTDHKADTSSHIVLGDLKPNTRYNIDVSAGNPVGLSEEVIIMQQTPELDNNRNPVFHSNGAKEPGTPIFGHEPEEVYYIINNNPVFIECDASPATEIKFKCAGQWISTNLKTMMMRDPKTHLNIVQISFKVTWQDVYEYSGDGDYWCECYARNEDSDIGTHVTKVSGRASVVFASKPGMPGVSFEVDNPTQVNLRITRPRFNGGVDVNRYVVRYHIDGQLDSKKTKVLSVEHRQETDHRADTSSQIVLGDLKPNTRYIIGVRAGNPVGLSEEVIIMQQTPELGVVAAEEECSSDVITNKMTECIVPIEAHKFSSPQELCESGLSGQLDECVAEKLQECTQDEEFEERLRNNPLYGAFQTVLVSCETETETASTTEVTCDRDEILTRLGPCVDLLTETGRLAVKPKEFCESDLPDKTLECIETQLEGCKKDEEFNKWVKMFGFSGMKDMFEMMCRDTGGQCDPYQMSVCSTNRTQALELLGKPNSDMDVETALNQFCSIDECFPFIEGCGPPNGVVHRMLNTLRQALKSTCTGEGRQVLLDLEPCIHDEAWLEFMTCVEDGQQDIVDPCSSIDLFAEVSERCRNDHLVNSEQCGVQAVEAVSIMSRTSVDYLEEICALSETHYEFKRGLRVSSIREAITSPFLRA